MVSTSTTVLFLSLKRTEWLPADKVPLAGMLPLTRPDLIQGVGFDSIHVDIHSALVGVLGVAEDELLAREANWANSPGVIEK